MSVSEAQPGAKKAERAPRARAADGRARAGLGRSAVAALVLGHAIIFFLAFHPAALWPLAFVAAAPLAIAVRDAGPRAAYLAAFAGFLLHGALTIHWLWLLEVAAWLGTAFGFGLYGVLFALLARPAARLGLPAVLWLPIVWCAVEHLRGTLFFTAFPWVYLGHAVFPLPMVQAADLGGQNLVSFAVLAVNGALVDLADGWRGRLGLMTRAGWRRLMLRCALPPALLLAALNAYGLWRPGTIEVREGPRVLAVQPNIPQSLKNVTEHEPDRRLADMLRLTREAARQARPDVIVWPETMLPYDYSDTPGLSYAAVDQAPRLRELFARLYEEVGAPFLAGSGHVELRDGERVAHNSIFHLGAGGEVLDRYDKMHLAPMSERAPFAEAAPAVHDWLRRTFIPPGFTQFEPGRRPTLFDVAGHRLAGSVCFDVTFATQSRTAVLDGADGVVNASNYAWFQDSAELDLARVHTMLRAIETRRGFVSVVNAGITHFVDPRGRITDLEAPDGRRKEIEGTLLMTLDTSDAETLFLRTGEAFAWALVALAALAALGGRLRRGRRGG